MASQTKELESSSPSLVPSVDEYEQNSGPDPLTRNFKVTFLAPQWGSSKGGISTINRELAINVAKNPKVDVTIFVLRCNEEDKKAALNHKIDLVEATEQPGYDELEWLNFPPDDLQIDVVVGHGVEYGHQAQVIRKSHKCKWVQVFHTAPEELGMYKKCSNSVSVNEKKHETEVKLCEMADFVVTVGPKLSESFRASLRACMKDQTVFEFTPGILAEFSKVEQVVDEGKIFKVLVFGRGDEEDFELKGFDIAAKAVATLDDTHLVFVGAPDGKQDEVKNRFLECGISPENLIVRSFLQSRESLKNLLCEVDLAVMPSRTEGFGLTGLEALSAGLPILVSGNSGFGEALRRVPFGSSVVVDSNNAKEWARKIKLISGEDRRLRLEESELLRMSYQKKYSWEKQSKSLVSKMVGMTHGTLPIKITIKSVTLQAESGDVVQQEESMRLIMDEMTEHFRKTYAAHVPAESYPRCLHYYLQGGLDLKVIEASKGSLRIIVECSTLEILERLWKVYSSGHLNAEAEERLLTDDIKRRFDVASVKLETTILQEDYLGCKLFLMGISRVNQDNELSPQDQTQAADETQIQTTEETEPMTVQLAVNYRDSFTNTQRENCTQQQEDERQHLVSDGGGSVLDEETSNKEDLPEYFQHLNVISDLTIREEGENSLRIAVECHNLESLERLWEDYHSGRLNAIAEKRLVIKSRFHVKSVNLTTTILEEDYLACKEFFTNRPQSNDVSPIMASKEITTQATEESGILTSRKSQIQQPEETQTRVTDKSVTMTAQETVIQSAEVTRTQALDGRETLTAGNTYTLSAKEPQTRCMEDSKTQATAETHLPSHEEIHTQGIDERTNWSKEETEPQSAKEIWTNPSEDMETLATDQTQISIEETCTQAAEILATENTQIKDPKETRTQMDESEMERSSENKRKHLALEAKKSFNPNLYIEALKINTTLTCLDLRGKQIDENGARSLSEVLKVNTTLTNLDVSENSIGPRGAKSIFEALKHNTTLTNRNVSRNNIGKGGADSLSIALPQNATLTNLNVSNNNIGEDGARYLSIALQHNATLTNLNVSQNKIGEGGASFLSSALEYNTTLTNLNVSQNNIGEGGACYLSSALEHNATLTNLNVGKNKIGEVGAHSLSSALEHNATLTNLNVSKNNIGEVGAHSLSSALKHNTTLTNLNVSNNNIGEVGAHSLSSALEHNTTLTNLNVSNNNIGEGGARFFSIALKHNATLTVLDVSENNADVGALSISEILKSRKISRLHKPEKREITDVDASEMKDTWRRNQAMLSQRMVKESLARQKELYEQTLPSMTSIPAGTSVLRPYEITSCSTGPQTSIPYGITSYSAGPQTSIPYGITSYSTRPQTSIPYGITSLEKEKVEAGIKIVGDDNSDPT